MKVNALVLIVAICTVEITYADWREDLKEEHVNRLVKFVDGMEDLLQSSAATKSTPAAWECYNVAREKFSDLINLHRVNVDQCIAPPAERSEAVKCCDKLKRSMIKEASVVSSTASECIDYAS